jgi:hypothetical protein
MNSAAGKGKWRAKMYHLRSTIYDFEFTGMLTSFVRCNGARTQVLRITGRAKRAEPQIVN